MSKKISPNSKGYFEADGSLIEDPLWVEVQEKAFTRWCNIYLIDRGFKVHDMKTDFQDGKLLHALLEIISKKKIPINTAIILPKVKSFENLNYCLDFCKSEGLEFVNIGAEDFWACNLKLILGLIWTVILRYTVTSSTYDPAEGTPKHVLLEWVKRQVKPYDIPEPHDFK